MPGPLNMDIEYAEAEENDDRDYHIIDNASPSPTPYKLLQISFAASTNRGIAA